MADQRECFVTNTMALYYSKLVNFSRAHFLKLELIGKEPRHAIERPIGHDCVISEIAPEVVQQCCATCLGDMWEHKRKRLWVCWVHCNSFHAQPVLFSIHLPSQSGGRPVLKFAYERR